MKHLIAVLVLAFSISSANAIVFAVAVPYADGYFIRYSEAQPMTMNPVAQPQIPDPNDPTKTIPDPAWQSQIPDSSYSSFDVPDVSYLSIVNGKVVKK